MRPGPWYSAGPLAFLKARGPWSGGGKSRLFFFYILSSGQVPLFSLELEEKSHFKGPLSRVRRGPGLEWEPPITSSPSPQAFVAMGKEPPFPV